MKYRKRPEDEIEAVQWTGTASRERRLSADRIVTWIRENGGQAEYQPGGPAILVRACSITGGRWDYDAARPGDYVARGGVIFSANVPEDQRPGLNFWVCEADTFEALYEAAP